MKQLIANILLVSCLILSAHSTLSLVLDDVSSSCCTECSSPQHDNEESDNGDCENKLCNPFTHCSCCLGFLPAIVFYSPDKAELISCLNIAYYQSEGFQFINDHWQPPKFG